LALAALEYLLPNQVLVALATDGHDNSDSAGALVDLSTLARAQNLHLEPKSFLNRSDSHSFFEELGDGLKTGLTGSNVSDMVILLNG
jgi:hydroxypyruvate reductase